MVDEQLGSGTVLSSENLFVKIYKTIQITIANTDPIIKFFSIIIPDPAPFLTRTDPDAAHHGD
jgi:hypothetical protein